MMLFYSNAYKANAEQDRPDLSLGGYVSSTPVQNDELAKVFSNSSKKSIDENIRETVLLALKNTSAQQKTVEIWLPNKEDNLYQYLIDVVDPEFDDCDDPYFEQLKQNTAKPFYADFKEINDQANALSKVIAPQAVVGIWIMRKLKTLREDLSLNEEGFHVPEVCTFIKTIETFDLNISF